MTKLLLLHCSIILKFLLPNILFQNLCCRCACRSLALPSSISAILRFLGHHHHHVHHCHHHHHQYHHHLHQHNHHHHFWYLWCRAVCRWCRIAMESVHTSPISREPRHYHIMYHSHHHHHRHHGHSHHHSHHPHYHYHDHPNVRAVEMEFAKLWRPNKQTALVLVLIIRIPNED